MSTIILASHGTDNPVGSSSIRALVAAVALALPQHRVLETFVDVQQPKVSQVLAEALAAWPSDTVTIVPLLLSTGYHVRQDIIDAVVEVSGALADSENDAPAPIAPPRISVTAALGPSPELTHLLVQRLHEAGWKGTDLTVLAVAGSSDAAAVEECKLVQLELQEALREIEVTNRLELGFLSAVDPRLKDLIPKLKFQNPRARFTVANYLLADGFFNGLANKAGAHLVAQPLLAADQPVPQQLIDVIVRRVLEAEAGQTVGCLKPNDPHTPEGEAWSCAAGCAVRCR
jgi:sirohydrochlorin ferrochelatase